MENKLKLTLICLLANFVLAGFIVQTGLLTQSFANSFNISLIAATKQFSILYGGYLLGTFLAYKGLDYLQLNTALIIYSLGTVGAALLLITVQNLFVASLVIGVVGTLGGVSVGIAGTILGKLWHGKRRQTMFLAQDASFNLGGTLYPFATVTIFTASYDWSFVYLFIAVGSILVFALTLTSQFKFDGPQNSEALAEAQWNVGIIGAGLALFLTIVAKYFFIIWLPNFAQSRLHASPEQAGQLISTIFAMALAGSIAGAAIVTRVRLTHFMIVAVAMGLISSIQFTFVKTLDDLYLLAGFFGIAIAVLYNAFTAYGIEFVKQVSHKHVAYVLLCGGAAQTIAPYISSAIADTLGVAQALMIGSLFYLLVILMLFGLEYWRKQSSVY